MENPFLGNKQAIKSDVWTCIYVILVRHLTTTRRCLVQFERLYACKIKNPFFLAPIDKNILLEIKTLPSSKYDRHKHNETLPWDVWESISHCCAYIQEIQILQKVIALFRKGETTIEQSIHSHTLKIFLKIYYVLISFLEIDRIYCHQFGFRKEYPIALKNCV